LEGARGRRRRERRAVRAARDPRGARAGSRAPEHPGGRRGAGGDVVSKREPPPVPRLLLGVSSLDQPVRTTRDRQLEVASRFKEPESLAVALVKGVAAGAQGVIAPPTLDVREALAELNKDLPIFARVAHTSPAEDLRWEPVFLADPGDVESRSSRAGKRAGAAAMNLLPLSMAGDLASRVLPRMEREAALFSAKAGLGIAVAAAATDPALPADQGRVFGRDA